MAWVFKKKREYFYHNVREDGRRRTVYLGRGPVAAAAAREIADRRADREAWADERSSWTAALALVAAADEVAERAFR